MKPTTLETAYTVREEALLTSGHIRVKADGRLTSIRHEQLWSEFLTATGWQNRMVSYLSELERVVAGYISDTICELGAANLSGGSYTILHAALSSVASSEDEAPESRKLATSQTVRTFFESILGTDEQLRLAGLARDEYDIHNVAKNDGRLESFISSGRTDRLPFYTLFLADKQ
ncbi:hypothetical protein ACVLV4_000429 [Rathayibacter agropyri]